MYNSIIIMNVYIYSSHELEANRSKHPNSMDYLYYNTSYENILFWTRPATPLSPGPIY